MEDENFNKELEDLFKLFKKLLEKESVGDIPGVDPAQLEQLKQFMSQFDDVKDEMKVEMSKVDPFTKQIIASLVSQLRLQLDPDGLESEPASATELIAEKEKELRQMDNAEDRRKAILATIDNALKNPELSDAEIDELLDKRAQITAKD